jgi:DNA modification methylase
LTGNNTKSKSTNKSLKSTNLSQESIKSFADKIICGDALKTLKRLPDESIDCVVTSPPYWALRDYGVKGQIGLESSIEEYLEKLINIFAEIRRILKPAGTCWVNFGDTYANKTKGGRGSKSKNKVFKRLAKRADFSKLETKLKIPAKSLCQIPSRFALKMNEQGWILRNEIIWHKPNAMPQSARDRFTVDFEKIFFFVKAKNYYFKRQFEVLKNPDRLKRRPFDPEKKHKYYSAAPYVAAINPETMEASRRRILKTGRNMRCVWTIPTRAYYGTHFASFPEQIIETPIKAGCPGNGIVLDPFIGSGTTAVVAKKLNRKFIGIDLNPEYVRLARNRLKNLS